MKDARGNYAMRRHVLAAYIDCIDSFAEKTGLRRPFCPYSKVGKGI
jgi:hypothetical protein